MRVLYDDQIFSAQRHGGISNYFVNLFREFAAAPSLGVDPVGFPITSFNEHLSELGLARRPPFAFLERRRALQAINGLMHRTQGRSGSMKPELQHQTFYFTSGWGGKKILPTVVTIHDMIPELFPTDFQVNPHFLKDYHVRNADAIVCVSETTKSDLLKFYPGLDVPIVVTPLGVSHEFEPSEDTSVGDYFLYVGTRAEPYKNFTLFAQAAATVIRGKSLKLKLVGGGPITADEAVFLRSLGILDQIEHTRPSSNELVKLYQNAIALVFPTRYEGFGLPTLEAMASGCPAILGMTPALQEVAGDAGIYFSEYTVDSLAEAMRLVVDDPAARSRARERGLARAEEFSWSRTAELTSSCYEAALATR